MAEISQKNANLYHLNLQELLLNESLTLLICTLASIVTYHLYFMHDVQFTI